MGLGVCGRPAWRLCDDGLDWMDVYDLFLGRALPPRDAWVMRAEPTVWCHRGQGGRLLLARGTSWKRSGRVPQGLVGLRDGGLSATLS